MIAGRYSLDREIGRGGMGAVWLGRDEVLGRAVAMKRVGLAPGGSTPDLERAEREARLAARLNHPHVVAVYDLVVEDDARWLVMEHVPGTTLAELVRGQGRLAPDTAADLLGQAADALAAAHAAGIVHRDVKPSNMLVTEAGRVKLSDFGIARTEADASLTQTGLVTGSPAYLAPEVASGRLATPPSDVWALGASLFHALAGHPPYDVGDNLLGALYRIVNEDPPRLSDAGWLAPLLSATMAREPGDRWTMAEVRDFLQDGPGARAHRPVPVARARQDDGRAAAPLTGPSADQPPTVAVRPVPADRPLTAPLPPAPASPPTGAGSGRRRRSSVLLPALLGVAGIVLVALAGYLLARGGEEDPGTAAPGSASSGSPSPSRSATAPPERPTAAGIDAFIRDYLRTAARDPSAGYGMLTPAFQRASGGLAGYTGFWGDVRAIAGIDRLEPDVEDREVRYTYRYVLDSGRTVQEDVRLRLEFSQGTYRIAGEA